MARQTLADIELTEAGAQHVLPGAERINPAGIAKRRASEPLRPTKPQLPCEFGLFGDDAAQLDLVDAVRGAVA
jgi:hypothetical protein